MHSDQTVSLAVWWSNSTDDDGGQELLRGLASVDPTERLLAEAWLVENGQESMDFLEHAIAAGAVNPQRVGPCMAEILRRELWGESRSPTTWLIMDVSCS